MMKLNKIKNLFPVTKSLLQLQTASFAYRGGASFKDFKKEQGKYGRNRDDEYRT